MSITRFGVSLEKELLDALDAYVKDNRFANRSQAIRQLIEKNLTEKKWKCDNIVAGAVTLVYASQKREIKTKITEIHSAYRKEILSIQSFQLNTTNSMDIIAVKGPSYQLTRISEELISIKGIQHGKLIMSKV